MKIEQNHWTEENDWVPASPGQLGESAQLALVFGSTDLIKKKKTFDEARAAYPNALILGCSTAGEICGTQVTDDSLVVTAIQFEHSHIQSSFITIKSAEESFQVGKELIGKIDKKDLVHIFVISDGININGSELTKGLTQDLPKGVTVTGGLSGDGARFEETFVIANKKAEAKTIGIVAFYGSRLKISYGSLGGWDPFGPERAITRSKGNILYEFDGQSALALYKKYLGEHANKLPGSGLLFPLSLRVPEGQEWVVRTILAVDENEQSMTFAGDVPEGSRARLMKANFERLIDGASGAARTSYEAIGSVSPDLAILISCVGRKMVLKQRIEEEVEGVQDVLGDSTILTGFYSYGEISPFTPNANCELHNQTMTITTISER